MPDVQLLEEKAISHSLAGFSFSKDTFSLDVSMFMNDTGADLQDDDDDDDFGVAQDAPMDLDTGGDDNARDFFSGDQAVGDDYGAMDMGGEDQGGFEGEPVDGSNEQNGQDQNQGRPVAFEPFDPRRVPNERDLILAMTDASGEGGSLDYFDQTFLKNWAGPEHWKLRKVVRKRLSSLFCASCLCYSIHFGNIADTTADGGGPKAKREKKEPFKIDFLTPVEKSQKEIAKEIFAPVARGGSINLPNANAKSTTKKGKGRRSKEKEKRSEQTLPDDMHFSSRQLVTLFLKPKFAVCYHFYGIEVQDNKTDYGNIAENARIPGKDQRRRWRSG